MDYNELTTMVSETFDSKINALLESGEKDAAHDYHNAKRATLLAINWHYEVKPLLRQFKRMLSGL